MYIKIGSSLNNKMPMDSTITGSINQRRPTPILTAPRNQDDKAQINDMIIT